MFVSNRSVYNQRLTPLCSIHSPGDHFLLVSLANALPKEWRRVFKVNETPHPLNQEFVDLTRFSFFLEGEKVDIEKLQAIRSVYGHFISKMSKTPTARKKIQRNLQHSELSSRLGKIYLLSFQITLDSKLREFQNKILHTNKMLFKFIIVNSTLCYFCHKELETLEHFCFHCEIVSLFGMIVK